MSTASVDQITLAIGKLYKNPSSLSTGVSGYGTELGLVKDVVVLPSRAYSKITAEEFGAEVVDYLDLGEAAVCTAVLRAPSDDDVVSTIFAGVTQGAASGNKIRSWPPHSNPSLASDYRAGRLLTERAIVLLFVPTDADRHPAFILYKALPMLDEAAELNFSLATALEYGVVFAGVRDTTDRVFCQGKLEDLSL